MMRVLWLVPVQLPAVTGETSMAGGGWLEGLRYALERHEPEIELGIAARSSESFAPVQSGNATYFSLGLWGATRCRSTAEGWGLTSMRGQVAGAVGEVVKRFNPDLVHVHGTEHVLGFAATNCGVPALATLQGLATVCEHFMLDAPPLRDVVRSTATRSFLRGAGLVPNYFRMRRRALDERAIIRGLRFFMGQTEWDRTVLSLLNPSARYFRTECVVQSPYYDALWTAPVDDRLTVLCTGGAAPYKGLETLLTALSILRAAGRPDIRLRIAGAVRGSAMWATLEGIVRRGGIADQVVWLGRLQIEALIAEAMRAHAFSLPSHIDNQPNALIEAMLMGMPVAAGAVGGVPELVKHEASGLLYHDREPFALAGALVRLLDDTEFASSLGREARRAARARHDPEAIAHRTRSVYDTILSEARG
jgi:glycosyltransferase involved in cell wall biosynthesis